MSLNPPRKILLDTDPGGDDIFALFWLQSLVHQGLVELVAVTTAEGNVSARSTFTSASKILTLGKLQEVELGRGVQVLEKNIGDATHIHGEDGMGNLSQTLANGNHDFDIAPDSDQLIIDKLNAAPGEITIVAIAPLTNLAAAEQKSPGILQKAREIVVMAGAFESHGNVTPHGEFNVAYNPLAAQIVLESRRDIVVLSLDVTRQLILTLDCLKTTCQSCLESPVAEFMVALGEFMTKTALTYRETEGRQGFLVHDAATIAYLFYPEIFLFRRATVRVETQGKWTKGQTLIDNRHSAKFNANAWVAKEVDIQNFFACFMEDLKNFLS